MRQLLEIKPGLFVKVHEIEAIEAVDTMKSKVYTHHNSYDSDFPVQTLESMINLTTEPVKEEKPTIQPLTNQFVAM